MARVAGAFAAFNVAEWAPWVAMLIYAYDRGGSVASGIVAIVQLVPAALFAPLGASLADHFPRVRILTIAYLAQATALASTAVALELDAPIAVVYTLAAIAAMTITLTRPAQNGLIPALAVRPDALTRPTPVLCPIENASILAGPALAGVLVASSGAGSVFAAMAAVVLPGAILCAGVPG